MNRDYYYTIPTRTRTRPYWERERAVDIINEMSTSTAEDATESYGYNERQPLLRERISNLICDRCSINCIVLTFLVLILASGLIIGIALSVDMDNGDEIEVLVIVNRTSWNATTVDMDKLQHFTNPPPSFIIITQTKYKNCSSLKECSTATRNQQQFDLFSGIEDIAFHFLIGGDGRIYEGRGWDFVGVVARNYNSKSIGIAFIGTYDNIPPNEKQLNACEQLIGRGVLLNKISQDYKLVAIDQLSDTKSAGKYLYDAVRKLPRWYSCDHTDC